MYRDLIVRFRLEEVGPLLLDETVPATCSSTLRATSGPTAQKFHWVGCYTAAESVSQFPASSLNRRHADEDLIQQTIQGGCL